jgi:hypothetical protein
MLHSIQEIHNPRRISIRKAVSNRKIVTGPYQRKQDKSKDNRKPSSEPHPPIHPSLSRNTTQRDPLHRRRRSHLLPRGPRITRTPRRRGWGRRSLLDAPRRHHLRRPVQIVPIVARIRVRIARIRIKTSDPVGNHGPGHWARGIIVLAPLSRGDGTQWCSGKDGRSVHGCSGCGPANLALGRVFAGYGAGPGGAVAVACGCGAGWTGG